jgi:hypothetical protein
MIVKTKNTETERRNADNIEKKKGEAKKAQQLKSTGAAALFPFDQRRTKMMEKSVIEQFAMKKEKLKFNKHKSTRWGQARKENEKKKKATNISHKRKLSMKSKKKSNNYEASIDAE